MECDKKKYNTGVNLKAVTQRMAAVKPAKRKTVLYLRRQRTDSDKTQACSISRTVKLNSKQNYCIITINIVLRKFFF